MVKAESLGYSRIFVEGEHDGEALRSGPAWAEAALRLPSELGVGIEAASVQGDESGEVLLTDVLDHLHGTRHLQTVRLSYTSGSQPLQSSPPS